MLRKSNLFSVIALSLLIDIYLHSSHQQLMTSRPCLSCLQHTPLLCWHLSVTCMTTKPLPDLTIFRKKTNYILTKTLRINIHSMFSVLNWKSKTKKLFLKYKRRFVHWFLPNQTCHIAADIFSVKFPYLITQTIPHCKRQPLPLAVIPCIHTIPHCQWWQI